MLNLLGLLLSPNMCSVLEDVLCALEKKIYSAVVGKSTLQMVVGSGCLMVVFQTSLCLVIVLSIMESER